ncbi:MAG: MFS transporter [Deltaproteobacteria bacterium]|nr:MFS transporter [Deltaproteobacteria bacterium]MBW2394073.1 MFS transporter [Deltaproteobacteria bacterium]
MLLLAHLGFLVFGTILVVVGSTQSALAAGLGIGLEGTGGLAAAVSLGLGIGVVSAGPPTDRWPRRPLFVMAALVASLGLVFAAMGSNVWQVGLGLGVAGAGAGFFETILNTVVAELDPPRAERRLASVHSAATAGAVAAPPLLAMLAEGDAFGAAFLACAAAFGLVGLLGLAVPLSAPPVTKTEAPTGAVAGPWLGLLPLLVASAAYVGFETALTAFAPALAAAQQLPPAQGVGAISALWLGLLLGRIAFLLSGRSAGASWLAGAGLLATLLLGVGLALEVRALALGFGALGFVLGIVFPVLIAVTARRFPERRATAVGLVAGAGALGGALVPWLGGVVGDRAGLPGTWAILIGCCLLLALAGLWARRRAS